MCDVCEPGTRNGGALRDPRPRSIGTNARSLPFSRTLARAARALSSRSVTPAARASLTMASTPRSEMPLASATMLEAWIVPPSAIGSLKGTPSSTTSTPAACMASSAGTVSASRGKPAVRYATKAGTPRARAAAKAAERRAAMEAAQGGWEAGGRGRRRQEREGRQTLK